MSTILVVDDSAIIREPISAALRQRGYLVCGASNGVEALAAVRTQFPSLILMDIAMPEMDGLECLRRLAADPRSSQIPVILLTSAADRESVVIAAQYGVHDYLLKSPFSLKELITRVQRRLEQSPGAARDAATREISAATLKPSAQSALATSAIISPNSGVSVLVGRAGAPTSPQSQPPAAPEALRSLLPIVTHKQIDERLDLCAQLKALSPAASRIVSLTTRQDCSIEEVVRAIRMDQAITVKVLKLANSVVYTRGEPVSSLHTAVTRIGLQQIHQAVMNIAVMDGFSRNGLGDHLSSTKFWEHSIACGLIAAEIVHGRDGSLEEADTAFTVGLLHDVGRMAYAQEIPDLYQQVLQTASELQLPLEQVESRMLLVNHADMMESVLAAWRFPKHLITPIVMHHLSIGNIRHMAPNMVAPVATLALANALAHALLLGSSGNLSIYPSEDLARYLKITPTVFQRIVEKIPDQTQDLKLAMLANAPSDPSPPVLDQVRQQIGLPLRPIYISANPAIDAFAVLARTLASPDSDLSPNLAIVHLTHQRERITVTEQLKTAEVKAGVQCLPLILISPNGLLALEDAAMAGRPVEMLNQPFAVSRFVTAVQSLLCISHASQ